LPGERAAWSNRRLARIVPLAERKAAAIERKRLALDALRPGIGALWRPPSAVRLGGASNFAP
jgi:hypothetical protein